MVEVVRTGRGGEVEVVEVRSQIPGGGVREEIVRSHKASNKSNCYK